MMASETLEVANLPEQEQDVLCKFDLTKIVINEQYLFKCAGLLKSFEVIVGCIYVGAVYFLAEHHYAGDEYLRMFNALGVTFLLGSIVFLVSSLIRYGPNGRVTMARINFIFHSIASVVLGILAIITIIPSIVDIISDGYSPNYLWSRYIPTVITLVFGLINAVMYAYSVFLVTRSLDNY